MGNNANESARASLERLSHALSRMEASDTGAKSLTTELNGLASRSGDVSTVAMHNFVRRVLETVIPAEPGPGLPSAVLTRQAAAAVDALAASVGVEPATSEAALRLGNASLLAMRNQRALAHYSRAIELGDDFNGQTGRAWALNRLRRSQDSLAACRVALVLQPDSTQPLAAQAFAYLQLGDREQRLSTCDRWVTLERGHKSLENRAGALAEFGRFDEGIADLEAAREMDRDEPCIAANYANLLQRAGRGRDRLTSAKRALELASRYLKLVPGDAVCLGIRARVHLTLARPDKALDDLSHALKLYPDDASLLIARGWVYLWLNAPAVALQDFERCPADPGGDLELRLGMAQALVQLGRNQDCLNVLGEEPDNSWGDAIRGLAFARIRNHASALLHFDRAIRSNPQDFTTLYNRAISLYELGRKGEALLAFEAFLAAHPDPPMGKLYASKDPDLRRWRKDADVAGRFAELMHESFSLKRFLAARGLDLWARRG